MAGRVLRATPMELLLRCIQTGIARLKQKSNEPFVPIIVIVVISIIVIIVSPIIIVLLFPFVFFLLHANKPKTTHVVITMQLTMTTRCCFVVRCFSDMMPINQRRESQKFRTKKNRREKPKHQRSQISQKPNNQKVRNSQTAKNQEVR